MKKLKIFSILLLVICAGSCKKFLDVNHDPNNPEEATPELVFPAGVESTANVIGGPWEILGEIWSQHWTSKPNAPQYQSEDRYEVQAGDYNYDLYGWEFLYTRSLMDFEWVKNTAKEQENWSFYLMANVMQAYTYQLLIDLFDQITFSDALKKVPAKFEGGEQVYDSLIVRLDDALSRDLNAATSVNPGKSDVVFNGDMNKWVAFANTLKLKIYMRQRFARPDVAQAGISALYGSGATFLDADAAFDDFADESGKDNYCYGIEFRKGSENLCVSRTILDYMDDKKDPRLPYMFTKIGAAYNGMYQGDIRNEYSYPTAPQRFSRPIISPLQPVYFISAVESYLLQAEAGLVYGVDNAEELYRKAVDLDMKRKEVPDSIIDTNVIYKAFTGDEEHDLEVIMKEKWIALANSQGVETFLERNRTCCPKKSAVLVSDENFATQYVKGEFVVSVTSVLPGNDLPKRLLLPSSEESKNPNFPQREPLYVPVWWDVRNCQ